MSSSFRSCRRAEKYIWTEGLLISSWRTRQRELALILLGWEQSMPFGWKMNIILCRVCTQVKLHFYNLLIILLRVLHILLKALSGKTNIQSMWNWHFYMTLIIQISVYWPALEQYYDQLHENTVLYTLQRGKQESDFTLEIAS